MTFLRKYLLAVICLVGACAPQGQSQTADSNTVEGIYQSIGAPIYIGSSWTQSEKFFVLFKDGRISEGLSGPPIESLKRSKDVGRWTRSKGKIDVRWDNGDRKSYKENSMEFNRCKRASSSLMGQYQDTIAPKAFKYIKFKSGGKFESNFKPGRSGYSGKSATYRGDYDIIGYAIEFRFSDGFVTRRSVCVPSGVNRTLFIDELKLTRNG